MALTEKLIEIVKRYPVLHDLANEDYKNIRKKDKVWKEIEAELGENGDELKRKWKNLGTVMRSTTFRPFMSFAKTESNITDIREENTGSEFITTDRDTISQQSSCSTQLDDHLSDIDDSPCRGLVEVPTSSQILTSSSMDIRKTKSNKRTKKKEEPESPTAAVIKYLKEKHKSYYNDNNIDAIDLIFLGYAKTVKMFSPRLQVTAKLKLAEVMSQLELEHQQEGTGSLASHPSTRCSSGTSNSIGCTPPLMSPSYSETQDSTYFQYHGTAGITDSHLSRSGANTYQILSLQPMTPQQHSQFTYNQPCFPDSPIIKEKDYVTSQNNIGSSSLTSYVANYNPNESVKE